MMALEDHQDMGGPRISRWYLSRRHRFKLLILILTPLAAVASIIVGTGSFQGKVVCIGVVAVFFLLLSLFYISLFKWVREVHETTIALRPNVIIPILERELISNNIPIKRRPVGLLFDFFFQSEYTKSYDLGDHEAILEVAQFTRFHQKAIGTRISIGQRWNSPRDFCERVMDIIDGISLPERQGLKPEVERRITDLFELHHKISKYTFLCISVLVIITFPLFIYTILDHSDYSQFYLLLLSIMLLCFIPGMIVQAMIAKLAWED